MSRRLWRGAARLAAALVAAWLLIQALGWGVEAAAGARNRREEARRVADQIAGPPGATYYVSPSGDDAQPGTSPATAWRTTARVNAARLTPGSRVLFAGDATFAGGLRFDRDDIGTPARPIVIGAYGAGRATIDAGAGDGIVVHNTGGFRIERLRVRGAGRDANTGDGIALVNDLAGNIKLAHLRIDQVEVQGFGAHGIRIDGNRGKSGYRDLRVTEVAVHDNSLAGIAVYGEFSRFATGYAHEDVYIGFARAYNNPGLPGAWRQHSGSGIVVSDVDGGTIERSVAFNNGALCESREGGPVGIWAWDSNRITIQHNESYGNRVAGPKDGGGFDLDGGVTNSVIQYNYAHDNDGAGYLLAQFPFARPFSGNVVRYNISADDGRRNGYGAIHLWGPVRDTAIYNNTIYLSAAAGNSAVAFDADRTTTTNIGLYNNLFATSGGAALIELPTEQPELRLRGNSYFAGDAPVVIEWLGARYNGLTAWQAATGQEQIAGRSVGLSGDPQLRAPDRSEPIDDPRRLAELTAFQLRPTSPLIEAGLDLRGLLQLEAGTRDYFGTPLPQGGTFDIGAHEVARGE